MAIGTQFVISEFNRERSFWEQLLLKRQSWYQELSTRVVESRLLLITTISAISAGAVAFVASDNLTFQNSWKIIAFFSFGLCLFLGPIALAFATFLDEARIPKNRDLEINTIKDLKNSAESLYYKGIQGNLNDKDIKGHFGLKGSIAKKIMNPPKRDFSKELLTGVFYSCLALYFIGIVSLMLAIL